MKLVKATFYISGPITGTDDAEERFNKAEKDIKDKFKWIKCKVINPIKIGKKTDRKFKSVFYTPTWDVYMKDCIKKLPEADYLFMLKNYEKSRGALIEKQLASELGIKILYEE